MRIENTGLAGSKSRQNFNVVSDWGLKGDLIPFFDTPLCWWYFELVPSDALGQTLKDFGIAA